MEALEEFGISWTRKMFQLCLLVVGGGCRCLCLFLDDSDADTVSGCLHWVQTLRHSVYSITA